jgi:molybdenum cofactor cytidylyltransferase
MSGARIAALVLAAGQSRRMGTRNKLLCPVEGVAMVCRVVDAALASRCCQVTVVTGWQAEQIAAALGARAISLAHNAEHLDGMASSLRRGLAALPADIDGALILLADMPWIDRDHVDRLVAAFDPAAPAILVPERLGRRGNPVLWPRRYFAEMNRLTGDVGARALLVRHADAVRAVPCASDAIFADIDTPAALAQLDAERPAR